MTASHIVLEVGEDLAWDLAVHQEPAAEFSLPFRRMEEGTWRLRAQRRFPKLFPPRRPSLLSPELTLDGGVLGSTVSLPGLFAENGKDLMKKCKRMQDWKEVRGTRGRRRRSAGDLADITRPPRSDELGEADPLQLLLRGWSARYGAHEGISRPPGNGGVLQAPCLGTASIYKTYKKNVSLGCIAHLFKSLNNNQQ